MKNQLSFIDSATNTNRKVQITLQNKVSYGDFRAIVKVRDDEFGIKKSLPTILLGLDILV